MNKISWPLMVNNVDRSDLDLLIEHLKQEDPKLTHGPKVEDFEEKWSKWHFQNIWKLGFWEESYVFG